MATVINNPDSGGSGNGVWGAVIVLILVGAGILFFLYGIPILRSALKGTGTTNQINVPIPNKVNVDVKTQ